MKATKHKTMKKVILLEREYAKEGFGGKKEGTAESFRGGVKNLKTVKYLH